MSEEDLSLYLQATPALDFNHPAVADFVAANTDSGRSEKENIIALYEAVRDRFLYNPYLLDLSLEGIRASSTVQKDYGWCVSKAVLLTACWRALGIPSRLSFGDVRNHLSTERMRKLMKTDIFCWHGCSEIYLEGRWVKATPAFNIGLCEKFNLKPLEFNAEEDSIFHPYDLAGNQHMEYVNDRGSFADLPLDAIITTFKKRYGRFFSSEPGDFDKEVDIEVLAINKDENG